MLPRGVINDDDFEYSEVHVLQYEWRDGVDPLPKVGGGAARTHSKSATDDFQSNVRER